jgi:hypothetical protein
MFSRCQRALANAGALAPFLKPPSRETRTSMLLQYGKLCSLVKQPARSSSCWWSSAPEQPIDD